MAEKIYTFNIHDSRKYHYTPSKELCTFHVVIWIKNNKNIIQSDYNITTIMYDKFSRINIKFKNKEYYVDFKKWWKRYITLFEDDSWTRYRFPKIIKSGNINGYVVVPSPVSFSPVDRPDHWAFIVKNCKSSAKLLDNSNWLFENEDDTIMFKLIYG